MGISLIEEKILWGIIIVLSLIIYLSLAGNEYIWFDEAYTFAMIRHSFKDIWRITAMDVHPPLYYFVLKAAIAPFNNSLYSAQLFSIFFYMMIIVAGGIQINQLFNKKIAIVFGILFLFYSFPMSYVVESRMYSMAAFLLFMNGIYAYKWMMKGNIRNCILMIIFGVASAYTHYFAFVGTVIIYVILLIAILVSYRNLLKYYILSVGISILCYLPWMGNFIGQLKYKISNEYWIEPITKGVLLEYLYTITGVNTLREFFAAIERPLPGKHIEILLLFIFCILVLISFLKCKGEIKRIVLGCMAIPAGIVLIGVMSSILVRPVFIIRYAIPAAPFIALSLGIMLCSSKDKVCGVCLASICVLTGVFSFIMNYEIEHLERSNILGMEFVQKYSDVDGYIVFGSSDHFTEHVSGCLSYYEPQKPIYVYETGLMKSGASPFQNIYDISVLDKKKADKLLVISGIDECEFKNIFEEEYAIQYMNDIHDTTGYSSLYLLEKY